MFVMEREMYEIWRPWSAEQSSSDFIVDGVDNLQARFLHVWEILPQKSCPWTVHLVVCLGFITIPSTESGE